jgi:hypothetical protein
MTKPLIASTDQNSKRFLRQGRETLGRISVQLHQGRLKIRNKETQRGTADSRQRVAAVVARHEATRGDVEVGFLTKVKQMPQLGPVKLFWIDISGEKMSADLAQKVPRYLQICEIVDSNGMATESRLWPLGEENIFRPGEYIFEIVFNADGIQSTEYKLKLNWTGNWKTAEISSLE